MSQEIRIICVSSSIGNWKDKLLKRTNGVHYNFWKHWNKPVVFFGLYEPRDYLKFVLHRGHKLVVWCGSDILQIGHSYRILQKVKAEHVCENNLERAVLALMFGKAPVVRPLFFNDPHKYQVSFKPSKTPHVYLFAHSGHGAEIQAGLDILHRIAPRVPEVIFHVYGLETPPADLVGAVAKNVQYHRIVLEEQVDQEIKGYQCHLLLHEFD
jgi:hypothetical protein